MVLNLQIGGGSAPPQPGVEIPTGAFVAKITSDAREEEMEENMQQVRNNLFEIFHLLNTLSVIMEVVSYLVSLMKNLVSEFV